MVGCDVDASRSKSWSILLSVPIDQFLSESFVRASGPGGQNVNKVATAVELRFDLGASDLSAEVKARVRSLAGKRITSDDMLVIDSREHRSQAKNREAARARLDALLAQAARPPRARRKTRPTAGSKEARLASKKRRAVTKEHRRSRRDDD
jgi:ribosome-associated protein